MKLLLKSICSRLCIVLTNFALASSLPNYPFIHATGEASLSLRPDISEIDFELTELSADPELTLSMIEKSSADVMGLLASYAVDANDIEAAEIKKYVSPVEYLETPETAKKYRLMRNFRVIVRDIQKWNSIVTSLLAKPYLGNFSINFGRSDMDRIQADLVMMATANAKENAKRLAQGLSVRLGVANGDSQSPLKSISTLLGLDGAVKREEISVQNKPITKDFAVPAWLKFKQNVEVVFRIKP
ncbi:SIMPL domain-containing protein [Undibacterium baiyunense]|uniref:SIMPL domain-containing protein n=1 Tax=Undibacterium baiyunense TaxID=2828731 RepID=A0A941DF21_9BURK|nr:SIMPL domain-containing protein [Undibacterium baiyunense]MBR7745092.1 SIMPL domain-containing protein [Undibacterium baiyunense]